MKLHNALWVPAVIGALSGMATNAYAVGTTAGTTINNTATLDFKVGATDQPQVESTPTIGGTPGDPTSFVVDVKVNFSVDRLATTTYTVTNDGLETTVMAYKITNLSNAPLDFSLAAIDQMATAGTVAVTGGDPATNPVVDTIDNALTAVKYYESDDAILDTGADTEITGTLVTSQLTTTTLADGATNATDDITYIYVTATDIGFEGTDADILGLETTVSGRNALISSVQTDITTETTAADSVGAVDIVHADIADSAKNEETTTDALELTFPILELVKTQAISEDPINGTTNPKFIPGAVVTYTLTLTNTGRGTATNAVIADTLVSSLRFGDAINGTDLFTLDFTDNSAGTTTPTTLTPAVDTDEGEVATDSSGASPIDTVTVDLGTGLQMEADDIAVVKFEVTIQ
ncbi:hypothetical protein [Oceanobacter antarcticus]|uniref:Uncharacterized protein n=1 Tax=Oceanobacter antarcticus TaxID=3133425 RepID=A0ABW8NJ34_9GAMM